MSFERICVVGLGYIGLPTAAVFASRKVQVLGVDVDRRAVDAVNAGTIHIVEPDLDGVVKLAVTNGYLRADEAPQAADAYLIAVPTPFAGDHQPDLSFVEAATRSVAPHLVKGNLVVLESTSPVGTSEKLEAWLTELRPDLRFPKHAGDDADINIAYCPERVLPGKILQELVENDRIVGGLSNRCAARAVELYRIFVEGDCLVTSARTAELCKLTENSFRDVNIAFANELSLICHEHGINVWELIQLANRHPRVNILQPGAGVGGHCIAVDPWFIVSASPKTSRLIKTARQVNDSKPHWVAEQVKNLVAAHDKSEVRIGLLGLSFKPDIDDLRESPALEIVESLAYLPDTVLLIAEPNIAELPSKLAGRACLVDVFEAIDEADIVVLLVDHRQFKEIPASRLAGKQLIDTRGIWASGIAKNN